MLQGREGGVLVVSPDAGLVVGGLKSIGLGHAEHKIADTVNAHAHHGQGARHRRDW